MGSISREPEGWELALISRGLIVLLDDSRGIGSPFFRLVLDPEDRNVETTRRNLVPEDSDLERRWLDYLQTSNRVRRRLRVEVAMKKHLIRNRKLARAASPYMMYQATSRRFNCSRHLAGKLDLRLRQAG
jgi:hypothetical protein